MKYCLFVILCLSLFGCRPNEPQAAQSAVSDSVHADVGSLNNSVEPSTVNLKNGVYVLESHAHEKVFFHFKNDTLHGPIKRTGGTESTGNLNMGKLHGPFRTCYNKQFSDSYSRVLSEEMFDGDTLLWRMFPAVDYGRPFPSKGIQTRGGRVELLAFYENGDTAYVGTFLDHAAIGIHRSFKPNNELISVADYTLFRLQVFDSTGHEIKVEPLSRKHPFRSQPIDQVWGDKLKAYYIKLSQRPLSKIIHTDSLTN
ncbi:MAG: hypothetical protein EP332_11670 [Bacteroidetes bacterium]|nr:MAG: hypothetical protein EP332_11670 [Bacteroidota bacterium]